ncbi:MAG: hypothetical protein ACO3QC_00820, partial [Phycisphaerales bacterium]
MSEPATTASDAADPRERAAWHSLAAWATMAGVFASGLVLDLWSKAWAFRTIAGYPVELDRERVLGDPSFYVPHHPRVTALSRTGRSTLAPVTSATGLRTAGSTFPDRMAASASRTRFYLSMLAL